METKIPLNKMLLKLLLIGIGGISGVYLALCIFLLVWQSRMIFNPEKKIEKFPQRYDLVHQEVWLPVEQEQSIHGW